MSQFDSLDLNALDSNTAIATRAMHLGLGDIRCNLTGQVIADMNLAQIEKAVAFERYQAPFADDEMIIESLEKRWLIQSSRPSPHLTNAKSKDGFKFLKEFYPRDLFAMLASRLVFENAVAERELESTSLKLRKMHWLIEFQSTPIDNEQMHETLNVLIQLDAIHNIRHCLYSQEVRDTAALIRDSEFNFETIAAFVELVENCGFIALTRMNRAPNGNGMALSAALSLADMLPEQLALEEEKQKRIEANRMMIARAGSKNASGKVKVNRGFKTVVTMMELGETIPPALAARYKEQLEKRKPKKAANEGNAKSSKATLNAKARFGDIDFGF